MKQLVLHSIRMHKIQSASIIVSVALSMAIVATFGLVYGGVQQGIEVSEARGGADVMAIPTDSMELIDETELLYTGAPAPVYMSTSILDELQGMDGVNAVSAQFYGQTLDSGCCSTTGETRLIGIDATTDFVVTALAGADAVAALDDHTVIVGSGVGGVRDDALTIRNESYHVVAVMAETGTGFDASIIGDIETVRNLCRDLDGYEHYWEKHGDPAELISCAMVDLADNSDEVLTAVKARISLSDEATPLVRSDVVDKSNDQLQSIFFLLVAAAVVMAVVTLLQLFARFYTSVWDRKKELALYRAVGASKAHLRRLIVAEAGLLVGAGLVVGIALGVGVHFALVNVMQDGLAFPYTELSLPLAAGFLVACAVVFALVSLLSIIVPLKQVERLDPSTAMQQGDID